MSPDEQLQFLNIPAAVKPNDRLFLGIFPKISVRSLITTSAHDLRAAHSLHGKPQAEDRLHATLHHLGDYDGVPSDIVRHAGSICAAVASQTPPFEVTFDHVMSFPGSRAFVLCDKDGNVALRDFQHRLGIALTGRGLKYDKSFTPHITLLYDRQIVAKKPVDPVSWTVDEFVLVHSLLGKTQYEMLGRWQLQG